MRGPICHECGQKAHSPLQHLGALIEDIADSFFDFDNRLFRTLPALYLRPGFLTREYFAGRRIRYLPPFRATFLLSVLAFLVIQLVVDGSTLDIKTTGTTAFSGANTPAEVRQMLDRQLAGLDQASRETGPIAAAGIETARAELKHQADMRLRALNRSKSPDSSETPTAIESLWLDRIADAQSLTEVQDLTPQAIAAIDKQVAMAPTGEVADALGALKGQVYRAAGERVAALAGPDEPQSTETLAGTHSSLLHRFGRSYAQRVRLNLLQIRSEPAARQRMLAAMFNVSPAVLLAMLPVFALLLKIMYLFKRRLYFEHLIVALHSHAFIFLSLLMLTLLGLARGALASVATWTQAPLLWLMWTMGLWIPMYLLLMQKRIYRQGWVLTIAKYSVLGLAYSMLLTFALVAVVLVALGSM